MEKFYEVEVLYDYYDGDGWGCAGTERLRKGFFSTIEKAMEVAKSKEIEDYAIEQLDGNNYGHRVEVNVIEHKMDVVEEYGNGVYNYCIKEKIIGPANNGYNCKLAIVVRKDENGEVELDREAREVFSYEFDSFEDNEDEDEDEAE